MEVELLLLRISVRILSLVFLLPDSVSGRSLSDVGQVLEFQRELETRRYFAENPLQPANIALVEHLRSKRFVGHSMAKDGERKMDRFQEWLEKGEKAIQRSNNHEVDVAQSRVLSMMKDEQELSNRLLVHTADAVMRMLNETRRGVALEMSGRIARSKHELLQTREKFEYHQTFDLLANKQGGQSSGYNAIHTTLQILIYLVIFALPCIVIIYCLRLAVIKRRQNHTSNNYIPVPMPGSGNPMGSGMIPSPLPNRFMSQMSHPSTYSM